MLITREAACRVLTRRIVRLSKSKTRNRAVRAHLECLLRMRSILLILSQHRYAENWPPSRLVLILIDPVSADLWPHLRRRRGLTLPQRFARWIVLRAHPKARPAIRLAHWRCALGVLRPTHPECDHEILASPQKRSEQKAFTNTIPNRRQHLPAGNHEPLSERSSPAVFLSRQCFGPDWP